MKDTLNEELNEKDNQLLAFCYEDERTVGQIARHLKISPASVTNKIKKLKELDYLGVTRLGQGRKTLVRTKSGDKTAEYFKELLKLIEERGGEVTQEEYSRLLPFNPYDTKEKDRFRAMLQLPYAVPKLVERKLVITEQGKKFLKENKQ